jgi:hypothetical protein
MSLWKRTTKEVRLERLPSEMVTAIQSYLYRYNLGPILSDALMLLQTDSEKIKKGLFGSAETVDGRRTNTALADVGYQQITVVSVQLRDVVVQVYA